MSKITFFEIPRNGECRSWNPNSWKTRLVLNYKGLDYETEWLEYPEIAPRLEKIGVTPAAEGIPYTVPTILLNDTPIMDSRKIATALEEAFPTPSLHLDHPLLPRIEAQVRSFFLSTMPLFGPAVMQLLNPASVEHTRANVAKFWGGLSVDEVAEKHGGEEGWKKVEDEGKKVVEIMREGSENGPFVAGEKITYSDFYIAAYMRFATHVGRDFYERLVGMLPEFGKVYEGMLPYLERDDH